MSGWKHGSSTTERGYGWAWQKLRKRILQRDKFLCQPCLKDHNRVTAAHAVDHIVAKANGGTDDPANLRAICEACHLDKSMADQGKRRRQRPTFGEDGWPV